jgi:hypothetical protein
MTFQVTASIPVAPEVETDIANDGWFPAISLATAREVMRIDGTIPTTRLRAALVEAISSVNDELESWKQSKILAGYATFEAVPSLTIDGIKRTLHRYHRAVHCLAKANLIERYRDYDSSNEGNKRADDLETNIDDLRRDYRWAISDLLDIPRFTIELI